MRYRLVNIALFGALLSCLLVTWTAGRDFSRLNLEFFPEMVHSVTYETFAPNENFRDGKTLQQPVSGTIVRPRQGLAHRLRHAPHCRCPAGAGHVLQRPFSRCCPAAPNGTPA